MTVLIFLKFLDFEQVSVDSEMPILGQAPRRLAELGNGVYKKISTERLDDIAEKMGIKNMVLEIVESDARMIDIDRRFKKELNKTGNYSAARHLTAIRSLSITIV